jgi:hypothetical protein
MGCGDTKTVKAHICLDYNHTYWLWLCEKHKKELEEFKGEVVKHGREG